MKNFYRLLSLPLSALEYIDVSAIGNTEAERFGEKGNGVMVFFKSFVLCSI